MHGKKMLMFHVFVVLFANAEFSGITYADEGHAVAASGGQLGLRTYVFLAFVLLTFVFAALYFNNKIKHRPVSFWKWAWIASLGLTVLTGTSNVLSSAQKSGDTATLTHIHGMGYSPDGQRLLFAAHDGLKVFSQGKWLSGHGEQHDYMGFATFDQGFYSSGHPTVGSKMKDPFGVVKSTDEGESLNLLTLYGETDFHLLAVSRHAHTIYAFNPAPNRVMGSGGLYASKDEGKTWTKSELKGYTGEPVALAVHPTNDALVAIGNQQGLYVSTDSGTTLNRMIAGVPVTALFFDEQGVLYAGIADQRARLIKIDITGKQGKEVAIPELAKDAVAYIAQNPLEGKELAFATFNRNVYMSHDGGTTWHQIADKGNGVPHNQ